MTPGQSLTAALNRLSVHTAGSCACKSLAAEMDKLGYERCREQRDMLAAKLKVSAAKMGYIRDSIDHFAAVIDGALDDFEAALNPVPVNSLAVVCCYFNPCRYRRPFENYQRFSQNIRQAGVDLYTIELAFDDQPYDIPDATMHVRGSSQHHKLWQKERLLNTLIKRVGANYDALLWIDADVILTRPDWVDATKRALSRWPVVQLFRQCFDIHNNKLRPIRDSTGSLWQQQHHRARDLNYSHPGYAWGGRTEWLLKYGLEETTVSGGGDSVMIKGFCSGIVTSCLHINFESSLPLPWRRAIKRWSDPVEAEIRGRLGFVEQTVIHLHHGTFANRKYIDRWKALIGAGYNPDTDIEVDDVGLIRWTDHAKRKMPGAVKLLAEAFAARREDDD